MGRKWGGQASSGQKRGGRELKLVLLEGGGFQLEASGLATVLGEGCSVRLYCREQQ